MDNTLTSNEPSQGELIFWQSIKDWNDGADFVCEQAPVEDPSAFREINGVVRLSAPEPYAGSHPVRLRPQTVSAQT
jgi:hypothetical protein